MFPILRDRYRQRAGNLSGGEQQMLAIGRALLSRPKLLMLDEPSLGLAPLVVKQVYEAIYALRQQGLTVLIVEQSVNRALNAADRAYVMSAARSPWSAAPASSRARRHSMRLFRLQPRRADHDRHPEPDRCHQPRLGLCAGRARHRSDLQHHATDQFCPWRVDHGRRLRDLCPGRKPDARHGVERHHRGDDPCAGYGASGLPAVAQGQSADPADRFLRGLLFRAARHPDDLRLAADGRGLPLGARRKLRVRRAARAAPAMHRDRRHHRPDGGACRLLQGVTDRRADARRGRGLHHGTPARRQGGSGDRRRLCALRHPGELRLALSRRPDRHRLLQDGRQHGADRLRRLGDRRHGVADGRGAGRLPGSASSRSRSRPICRKSCGPTAMPSFSSSSSPSCCGGPRACWCGGQASGF